MNVHHLKQGATKWCAFGGCKSDSRRVSVPFIRLPKPCLWVRKRNVVGDENHIKRCSLCAKSKEWILKCGREKISQLTDVKQWHYICVLHFVNKIGPTAENPFPLPVSEAFSQRMKQQSNNAQRDNNVILNGKTVLSELPTNVIDREPSARTTIVVQKLNPDTMSETSEVPERPLSGAHLEIEHTGEVPSTLLSTSSYSEPEPLYHGRLNKDVISILPVSDTSEVSSKLTPAADFNNRSTQTSHLFKSLSTLEDNNKMLKEKLTASRKENENLRKLARGNGKLRNKNRKYENYNKILNEQLAASRKIIKNLRKDKAEHEKLRKKMLHMNLKGRSFEKVTNFVESLKISPKKCKFYTALTFNNIIALFTFLSPVDNMRYWGDKVTKSRLKSKKCTHLEELILVLVRLRRGLLVEDMKHRFNLSTGYISKIVTTWVQHCYLKFNVIRPSMMPTREKIKKHLPAIFKNLKNIRVIIDCAEFYCESPSNFEHQSNLYSSYKATTTFKVLLGCTPNGAISFVSDLFEGSISDKELVQQSNLLDLLQEGDLVLADRGFTISDLTNERNISLNIPPFLVGRDRLTAEEEIDTKLIAKTRIYIEHIVAKIKQFRILKKTLPLNMRGIMSQIVFVCACLVNFQDPIIK